MARKRELDRRITLLEDRIANIERDLARLRTAKGPLEAGVPLATDPEKTAPDTVQASSALHSGPPGVSSQPVPPVMGPLAKGEVTPRRERAARKDPVASIRSVLQSEDIVSKIGIGLLLIGLAFMFKFGIDRGWITPPVRIGIGFLTGLILLVGGLRVKRTRRPFSRVLLGGSMAAFYVSIFAAYQLYALFSYEVAFSLMVAVTASAFTLAIRQDDVVLSLIATAGGLGTPFLLFTGAPGLLWLILYTCVVCAGAVAIYAYRGWRWLVVVTAVGGWTVLTHVWLQISGIRYLPSADRVVYQMGVLLILILVGVLPAVREVMAKRTPERWPTPSVAIRLGMLVDRPGVWLAVASPLVALILSRGVWHVDPVVWGAIEVVFATAYWAAYLFWRTTSDDPAVSGFGLAAGLLLAISWFDLFADESLTLFALAVEAGAILWFTRTQVDRPVRILGHLLFGVAASWMAVRLAQVPAKPSLVSLRSLVHLAVIGGLVGASGMVRAEALKSVYRVAGVLLLALAWASLVVGGSVRVVALAAEAIAIAVWVSFLDDRWLRYTAHFLFVALAFAILQRTTVMAAASPPLVNGASLADLSVIAIASAASFLFEDRRIRLAYRFGAYVAFLLWFWRDLVPLEDGHAYVSIAWGCIAIALIVGGWRTDKDLVRQTGLATLGVVVLKLFLVDLSEIDPVWRIILFIGFGCILLVTSYLFPSIWRGERGAADETEHLDE